MKLEYIILAHMMEDESFKHTALERLSKYHFRHDASCALIFETIQRFTAENKKCQQQYIFEFLGLKIEWETTGCGIMDVVTYETDALQALELLQEKHALTRLNKFSARLSELTNGGYTVQEVCSEVEEALEKIRPMQGGHKAELIGSMTDKYYDGLMALKNNQKSIKGLSTGFNWLDIKLSGLNKGNLIILAANPSIGKSAFANQLALNVALRGGVVLFHSLEMPRDEILDRSCSLLGQVDHWRLRNGWVCNSDTEMDRILEALNRVNSSKFYIDDSTNSDVQHIRNMARKVINKERKIDLIVVDHLQKMRYEKGSSAEERIANTTKALEMLSKDIQVPVMLLSQLNRANEKRDDKTPILADLRGSGMIEADANAVVFLHANDRSDPTRFLIVAKNRGGTLGAAEYNFEGKYVKFSEPEKYANWNYADES